MSVECQVNEFFWKRVIDHLLIKLNWQVSCTFSQLLGGLLQIKYKQSAEMEKANFTSVVDTPEIIHAQQVKNLSSQVRIFIRTPSLIEPSYKEQSFSINS